MGLGVLTSREASSKKMTITRTTYLWSTQLLKPAQPAPGECRREYLTPLNNGLMYKWPLCYLPLVTGGSEKT